MIRTSVAAELRRTNYAGRTVTLAEGVAVSGALTIGAALRARPVDALVLGGIGALGLADDVLEPRRRRDGAATAKGLRGHFGALRRGELTTGAAKALGIPALALLAAAAGPAPRTGPMVVADAALVAGTANLANLLDLRPGRALKAVLPAAALLALPPVHEGEERARSGRDVAWSALLPGLAALYPDLREHGMLGDAGANALGAAVGIAATRRAPVIARLGLLGAVVALTLASEKVSFSAVIDRTPPLRALDRLGRRAAPGPSPTGLPG